MIWIKICGTTNPEDAVLAMEAGADALGFIFAPSARRIEPAAASDIVRSLPATIEKIGVFVNEPVGRVLEISRQVRLTAIQLHGDEEPAYVRELSAALASGEHLRIFKAIAVQAGFEELMQGFLSEQAVDGLLLDSAPASAASARGGSGRTFDWDRAAAVMLSGEARIVVGGGLSPGNVGEAVRRLQPWGVDVCSGVEREPGRKDREKVKAFVAAVRAAENTG